MVYIDDYNQLDYYKNKIQQYQQHNKQYKILINFQQQSGLCSIDSKIELLTMIDLVNANKSVGIVSIGVDSYNEWNNEIIAIMIDRYTNLYGINLWDGN